MKRATQMILALSMTMALQTAAFASDSFRCESKDGKEVIKDVKNRKECNAKGGKWAKVEGHDHASGEESHDHEKEGEKKEEKK